MKDLIIRAHGFSVNNFKIALKTEHTYFIVCIVLMVVSATFAFPPSYMMKSNVFIGFALLPIVLSPSRERSFNTIWLMAFCFFAFVAWWYAIRIAYFFSIAFLILFMVELLFGRVNKLILFLLVFMSPFFQLLATFVGFPIRLQLSSLAGQILSLAGLNIVVDGNMIAVNGANFNVDQACMGLNMFDFAMLMGVFIIAWQYRTHRVTMRIMKLCLFFAVVFAFTVLSNLIRIVLLVLFEVPAEAPMHEIVGLLCFGVYVMLPICFIGPWMVRKWATANVDGVIDLKFSRLHRVMLLSLTVVVVYVGVHIYVRKEGKEEDVKYSSIAVPGYQTQKVEDGIISLYNGTALVYVKPIPEFFSAEHTPLICWVGSGFHFEGVRKAMIGGNQIYVGQLAKPGESLATAWWYQNTSTQTIDQLDWRLRMLRGEGRFFLVNVSAKNEPELLENVRTLLNTKTLTPHADK